MSTDAQIQYLEEVLGLSADRFVAQALSQPEAQLPASGTLVLTPPLNEDEQTLLQRILSSIKLTQYRHVQSEALELGRLPENIHAPHVLLFAPHEPGRVQVEDTVWWILPPLIAMLGTGAEVAATKKAAWALLQSFAKEGLPA